jgi:hypothetical protein
MIFKDGVVTCECGARAVMNLAVGWKCPEHGVTGKKEANNGTNN